MSQFTIQNVPIKFLFNDSDYTRYDYLQYKMFLLNDVNEQMFLSEFAIYNTKCSY